MTPKFNMAENNESLYCQPVLSSKVDYGSYDDKLIVATDSGSDVGAEWPRRQATTTMRIPCKARGLIDGHNPRTAYMEIPPDAPHGLLLICSHPTCARSGRRFRYCAICEIPVAKRNFNKRHSHGYFVTPTYGGDEGAVAKREEEHVYDSGSDTQSGSKRQRLDTSGDKVAVIPETVVVRSQSKVPDLAETDTNASSLVLSDSERAWLELFHKRPKTRDAQEIEKWTTSIVEVALSKDESAVPAGAVAVRPAAEGETARVGEAVQVDEKEYRLLHERLLSSCSILEDASLYGNLPFDEFEW